MFQKLPPVLQTLNQIISMSMVTLCMLTWQMSRKSIGRNISFNFPLCRLRESEELNGKFHQVSYHSAEGWHRIRCEFDEHNTFDTLIKDRTILQPSSLRMEVYGNSAVEVFGKFHAFLRWKGCVYRQLFYVTNANDLPNLLSWDSCYTQGVIRPCYSVETTENSNKFQVPTKNQLDQRLNYRQRCILHC